jgi:predicted  nucleic acid-binding Zn-ribbon protein
MDTQTLVAIAGITLAAGGAIVGHVCFSVWWASKITTTLDFLKDAVSEIGSEFKSHKALSYSKEEATQHNTRTADAFKALWTRVDEQRERIDDLEREVSGLKGAGK